MVNENSFCINNRAIAKVIFMIPQTLIAKRFEIAHLTFAITLMNEKTQNGCDDWCGKQHYDYCVFASDKYSNNEPL